MIIYPKQRPVIKKLNSYFLNIPKFIEHYQGEIGTGCVALTCAGMEAAIFFNKDDLINVVMDRKTEDGARLISMDEMIGIFGKRNFSVNLYEIEEALVDYWANLPKATVIYSNLSTDFTNLEKLIAKMQAERLTGYIDVTLSGDNGRAVIFFCGGKCLGASHSWESWRLKTDGTLWHSLMSKAADLGAVFHVLRMPLGKETKPRELSAGQNGNGARNAMAMLEALLNVLEDEVRADKRVKADFTLLLKKKFVEKADSFPFLDPFAAEFDYCDHRLVCHAAIKDRDALTGVTEVVREISAELGIQPRLQKALDPWREKYAAAIKRFSVQV